MDSNIPEGWTRLPNSPNYQHADGFVAVYLHTNRGHGNYSVHFVEVEDAKRTIHNAVSVGGLPTSDVLRRARKAHQPR